MFAIGFHSYLNCFSWLSSINASSLKYMIFDPLGEEVPDLEVIMFRFSLFVLGVVPSAAVDDDVCDTIVP